VARALAVRGGRVEIVGTVPPDGPGDRLLLELATAGVGHAAVLRTPATALDPADLELALRYLPDLRVIVLLDGRPLVGPAAAAAAWSGAALIVAAPADERPDALLDLGERGLVVAAPARDPDGAFAGLLADLALRLDGGEDLTAAWSSTVASLSVEPVTDRAAAPRAAPRSARPASGRRSARHSPGG
jgi:hypothetical protein